MNDAFRALYASELEYLGALAEEVGQEHARLGPLLGRGADPGVTRLVQNVSYLSARLRERLDDDLPEVIHPVVESLAPWLLASIPSATILELLPEIAMKEPLVVRAGSPFASQEIDGAPCLFRSCDDVVVRPWSLDAVEVASERHEVRLRLRVADDASLGPLRGNLRLFLDGPIDRALHLRSLLLYSTARVFARVAAQEVALGGITAVPAVALSRAEALDACFALRAYFAWPTQLGFVDAGPLDPIGELPKGTRSIEIVFELNEAVPKELALDVTSFRLHALPVVNVHKTTRVSVPYVGNRSSVRAPRAERHVHTIERVTLVREDLSTIVAEPFARFFPPVIDASGRMPLLYRVERTFSPVTSEVDLALSFVGDANLREVTTIDVDATLSDGDRAARVGIGQVCVATVGSPALVTFRNVTAVTRCAPPSLASGRLWEWVHVLKASFPQLADREALSRVLAIANIAAFARWPEAKPGVDSFDALLDVRWRRATRAERSQLFPGAIVEVDLDLALFAGRGDVDAFGERLAALLTSTLHEHEWLELVVGDGAGRVVRTYPPAFGTRAGL